MNSKIIDMSDISDSKEVYSEKPNPIFAVFIYSLIIMLLVAIIYSFYGKIEVVATASGMVRPNEDISTVSSLVGGKVTSVNFTDGQAVKAGDVLLTVDTSDSRIKLNGLLSAKEDYEAEAGLVEKFLNGIQSGKNPFSSDPSNSEYEYYVQYRNFELTLNDMRSTSEKNNSQLLADANKNSANIESVQAQIKSIQYQINGLTHYKDSIDQGKNLASGYPEYSTMYLLYYK